jgi:phospholipid/cholesterol/gamma-HCH transport system ATP-binding protein
VDDEIIKLRDLEDVSAILVTHQLRDAFYVAQHHATNEGGRVAILPADRGKCTDTEFLMLKDGAVLFEGSARELRASTDPYIQSFLS